MKILSFIVPLYNSAKWLEKCLCSVLNQDISEDQMEIICINDGSPDNSADMAREIGKSHPSIIVIDQPNQGPSGARNTGMKAATGKYLAFVDPDDFVEPNVYGQLVQQMEDEQLDMLRFNYQIVDEDYNHVEKRPFEKAFNYSPKLMSGAEFLATRLDIACNIWRYIYRREIITANNIWCFTGFCYESLIQESQRELLEQIDVLVDGPFVQSLHDPDLLFRGSSNQRLIDVQKSLYAGRVILWESAL